MMFPAKKYLSILLVLLVCVPIADKSWDDYSHLLEDKCGDVSTHFCPAEHHCPVCDYVFSAPSDVPSGTEVKPLEAIIVESTFFQISSIYLSPNTSLIQLRGPPNLC